VVALTLPKSLRPDLKTPMGAVYTDAGALLSAASEPVVAVGDIVTYHLLEAGYRPAVALVDERTKRTEVEASVRSAIGGFDREMAVGNPAGTVTGALLDALTDGLAADGTTLIRVDGEEDLAALPAVLAVPAGATVVYGQPNEGMVLVEATAERKREIRSLLERMDGPTEQALARL
jgi:uncharacterized protein (UPF0218 family)